MLQNMKNYLYTMFSIETNGALIWLQEIDVMHFKAYIGKLVSNPSMHENVLNFKFYFCLNMKFDEWQLLIVFYLFIYCLNINFINYGSYW